MGKKLKFYSYTHTKNWENMIEVVTKAKLVVTIAAQTYIMFQMSPHINGLNSVAMAIVNQIVYSV